MRVLFAVAVVVACVRLVWPLTEGAANCLVAGDWSDVEGGKRLRVWRASQGNTTQPNALPVNLTTHLELNMSDYRFAHESTNATRPQVIYNSTAYLVVLANATGPNGYASKDKTIVEALCSNDMLFVEIVPPADMAPEETSFTLRRRAVAPLSEALQENTRNASTSSSPDLSPRFILVNITLPNRHEDDSVGYEEEETQKTQKTQRVGESPHEVSVSEIEAVEADACCGCRSPRGCDSLTT